MWSSDNKPKFIIVLYSDTPGKVLASSMRSNIDIYTYEELLLVSPRDNFEYPTRDPNSIATLVYTSGTTSKPKGVILKHSNLMYQIVKNTFTRGKSDTKFRWFLNLFSNKIKSRTDPQIGDVMVSILPCWHVFERSAEYVLTF